VEFDRSNRVLSHDVYGCPEELKTRDGHVLLTYENNGDWPGKISYHFYVKNNGGNGDYVFKAKLNEDIEETKTFQVEGGKAYVIRVVVAIGPAVAWTIADFSFPFIVRLFTQNGELLDHLTSKVPAREAKIDTILMTEYN